MSEKHFGQVMIFVSGVFLLLFTIGAIFQLSVQFANRTRMPVDVTSCPECALRIAQREARGIMSHQLMKQDTKLNFLADKYPLRLRGHCNLYSLGDVILVLSLMGFLLSAISLYLIQYALVPFIRLIFLRSTDAFSWVAW